MTEKKTCTISQRIHMCVSVCVWGGGGHHHANIILLYNTKIHINIKKYFQLNTTKNNHQDHEIFDIVVVI